ncbi:MerR family transcriptional regulator [Cryptosporangium phraense]|uniref:MerR family transcriptional regulator n=1 Tax=Cryptosporangium phraense TaxID=2593070 RepID=A0A545AFC2_9ACTN|nr:MerR family transcriptional regulator [Cryptosporangium phraense]TQS40009.1 MerR family transcriptional regulator [Cryptosporangium phraense]
MSGVEHYSIGELSRRTGLTVKAIRFYADRGIVPPTGRNAAGHRIYDSAAAARLELVRALRDLGIDLATIRRVLAREVTVGDVAGAHAAALDVQIRALVVRRAVLTAIADSEVSDVTRLAALSENERQRLVDEFLGSVFSGLDRDPAFAGMRRSLTPARPDDPSPAQASAWAELVELAGDPDFRARMRRLAEQHAADRAGGGIPRPEAVAVVRAVLPAKPEAPPAAGPILDEVVRAYARAVGEPDGPALRERLASRLALADDPRRTRYEHLLAIVNGWPADPDDGDVVTWCREALDAVGQNGTRIS